MIDCQDYQFYKTLLESTRAIPWKIDWRTKEFSYIGPQIESVLGWPQDSWKTAQDWIDRIHEEDREKRYLIVSISPIRGQIMKQIIAR